MNARPPNSWCVARMPVSITCTDTPVPSPGARRCRPAVASSGRCVQPHGADVWETSTVRLLRRIARAGRATHSRQRRSQPHREALQRAAVRVLPAAPWRTSASRATASASSPSRAPRCSCRPPAGGRGARLDPVPGPFLRDRAGARRVAQSRRNPSRRLIIMPRWTGTQSGHRGPGRASDDQRGQQDGYSARRTAGILSGAQTLIPGRPRRESRGARVRRHPQGYYAPLAAAGKGDSRGRSRACGSPCAGPPARTMARPRGAIIASGCASGAPAICCR